MDETLRWWTITVEIHGEPAVYHTWREPKFIDPALDHEEWLTFTTAEDIRVRLRVEDITSVEYFQTKAIDTTLDLKQPPKFHKPRDWRRKKKALAPK